jgi:hypothetical protein
MCTIIYFYYCAVIVIADPDAVDSAPEAELPNGS